MRKKDLVERLETQRARFMDTLQGLTPEQMMMPGACGIWSVKDVVAHLTAWQSELVTGLNQVENNRVPQIINIDDLHGWNAEQYHANASRPLEVIMEDFAAVHKMLLRMIDGFDEKQLFAHRRYKWMEGEPLAYLIEENASLHEDEHAEDIARWREEQGF